MCQSSLKWSVPLAVLLAMFARPMPSARAQTPADNTKVNTRDRAKDAVTADQQKDNATDRDLTQKIRRALMQDKTLSTYAHNVKVIAQAGQVTLKGPVRSEDERKSRRSQGGRRGRRPPRHEPDQRRAESHEIEQAVTPR